MFPSLSSFIGGTVDSTIILSLAFLLALFFIGRHNILVYRKTKGESDQSHQGE